MISYENKSSWIKCDARNKNTPQMILNICNYMRENNIEEMPFVMNFGEVEYKTMNWVRPYDFTKD